VGDVWIDSDYGVSYTYINDGNSSQWVELSASGYITSGKILALSMIFG
jgi:hypothetical protein